ncbi:MAG: AI-2E family transporter [Chloroflexi bacterium]|nr:AI-2E family transporter [Chloroflexota bacterium]
MVEQAPQPTSPLWQGRTKRTVALIALVIVLLALWQLADTLPTVIVALILAYLLYPVTNFFSRAPGKRFGLPRGLGVLMTFIFVVLLLLLLLLVVVPALARQFTVFAQSIPDALRVIEADLETRLSQPVLINNEPLLIDGQPFIPLEQIREALGTTDILQLENVNLTGVAQTFLSSLGGLTRPAFGFLGTAFSALINGVFFLTMLFYLLKDGGMFVRSLISIVPSASQPDAQRLFGELGEVWNAYLRGQLILSSFIGVAVFTAATLLGLPNALVLGLISFTLEFIPTIGPTIALLPAALLALFSQSTTIAGLEGVVFALVVIVVWLVIQNIQAVVVTPRVMGDSLNLHPFVILLAVLAGASLADALGVILAAPMVASVRLFGQYIYGKLLDRDPFPPPRPPGEDVPRLLARMWNAVRARFGGRAPARGRN